MAENHLCREVGQLLAEPQSDIVEGIVHIVIGNR